MPRGPRFVFRRVPTVASDDLILWRQQRVESGAAAGGGVAVPTRLYRWVFHRLLLLETSACAAWYTCEQAMEIVSAFPWQVHAYTFMRSRT